MPSKTPSPAPLGIKHISCALPENIRSNDELIQRHGFSEAFLSEKLGISERRFVGDDQASSDLAFEACQKLLTETGIGPEEIECLVVVTQTPDYLLPHTAALLQNRLGLPKSTASFDISLGCSGYVYGLSVITSFMQANGMRKGLLVTAETYSRLMEEDDRDTIPLFGDGAAATLIGENPDYLLGHPVFGTDGSGAHELIAHGTGSRLEPRQTLQMSGHAIFNFMMDEIPGSIELCLKNHGVAREDVDLWIFHQASKKLLRSLSRHAGIDPEKVVIDMQDIGNTTSSTIPFVLSRNPLDPARHKFVVVSGFGVGLSWATCLLTRNPELDASA